VNYLKSHTLTTTATATKKGAGQGDPIGQNLPLYLHTLFFGAIKKYTSFFFTHVGRQLHTYWLWKNMG
jgi:hypothetical protein